MLSKIMFAVVGTPVFAVVCLIGFGAPPVTAQEVISGSSEMVSNLVSEPTTQHDLIRRSLFLLREQLKARLDSKKNKEEQIATTSSGFITGKILGAAADGFFYRSNPDYNWKAKVKNTNGLKVVWWNVECGAAQRAKNVNIQNLVKNSNIRPDVLIIGEYCSSGIFNKTLTELKKNGYVHDTWIKRYSAFHGENGMRIFSRLPLNSKSTIKLSNLNRFFDKDYVQSCVATNYKNTNQANPEWWKRKYAEIKVTKGGDNYTIAAIHFANPWPFLKDCLGSKYETAFKLTYGTHNPTFGQARTIANKYTGEKRTLVIGDTNAPKKISIDLPWPLGSLTIQSNPYELMAKKLGRSDISSFKPTAFGSFGRFSIDHAFASSDLKVRFADIIPFAGSDHSAIYTIIK